MVKGYDALEKLTKVAQKRVDDKVGTFEVELDPVVDATTIAALKRQFPDANPNKITYEQYKKCLSDIRAAKPPTPAVTASDIRAAKADPLRKNFGGLGKVAGSNRAKVSSPANVVKPVDLDTFQKSAVISLFQLMLPLLAKDHQAAIVQHKIDTPHSDKRLKKNVKALNNSLNKLLGLDGVSFEWISHPERGNQLGFLAQDVEEVIPEVVSDDKEGMKHLDYGALVPLLTESIKEQQRQIELLTQRLEELEAKKDDKSSAGSG